jgi:hypothetical protein
MLGNKPYSPTGNLMFLNHIPICGLYEDVFQNNHISCRTFRFTPQHSTLATTTTTTTVCRNLFKTGNMVGKKKSFLCDT